LSREIFEVPVDALFDLLIISPGGHPKDINLYQAQKALGHASLIVREGGAVILVAACPEGTGSPAYEAWMEGVSSYEEVFARFTKEGFRVGPHKAFQIARDASWARTYLISDMSPDRVERLLLYPAASVDAALAAALPELPAGGRVGVIPYATATIPV
jgi:nickel-dependent lactate racemase